MDQRLKFLQLTGGKTRDGHLLAEYLCLCGKTAVAARSRVKNGYTRSCGCLSEENKPGLTHGGRGTPEYSSWSAMRTRCYNPRSKDYAHWGGRGIKACSRWDSFANFLSDMGKRPAGTSLDRIDPSGDYEPGNCRWATPAEQARNRSDLTMVTTPNGVVPLVEYAAAIGLTRGAAHLRLKRGKMKGVSYA